MQTVAASGNPQVLGRTHGQQTAAEIHSLLQRWRDVVAHHDSAAHGVGGGSLDALLDQVVNECGFRETTQRLLPHLVAEVDGIAEGADISADTAFALNCMDEAWWLGSGSGGCSVLAVGDLAPDAAVIGQNMDLDTWMDRSQVALRLRPDDGPAQVLMSRAGMVGLCGANEAGLAVMVNTLDQLPTDRAGVPVAFIVRAVLEQTSLDGAVEVLHALPHASGQSYTLASPDGVLGFECGAGVVNEYRNDAELPARRWHTNHPIAGAQAQSPDGDDDADWVTGSTGLRMDHLDAKAAGVAGGEDLRRLLSDSTSGICMFPGRWRDDGFTFASIVVSLTRAAPPEVAIAPGPPDRCDYQPVPFA
jgi:isopenicillin-N N-acyltransferase-like protein